MKASCRRLLEPEVDLVGAVWEWGLEIDVWRLWLEIPRRLRSLRRIPFYICAQRHGKWIFPRSPRAHQSALDGEKPVQPCIVFQIESEFQSCAHADRSMFDIVSLDSENSRLSGGYICVCSGWLIKSGMWLIERMRLSCVTWGPLGSISYSQFQISLQVFIWKCLYEPCKNPWLETWGKNVIQWWTIMCTNSSSQENIKLLLTWMNEGP